MNRYELSTAELEELGRTAGFDAIGATSAEPFPELISRLKSYAERGLTGFECEDISLRVDPARWMPEVNSLISVAMAYLTPEGKDLSRRHPDSRAKLHGQVTVYAYGEDYHRVLNRRLAVLQKRLEERLGRPVRAKVAVDTSPLVDRRVAERAGIGWVGKNCMFFTPQHGSFVFLGTLLVDVSIEPASHSQLPRCGACTQCLDACPTGALVAPGVIDATRCLSYITQMKGMIPRDYRIPLGRRVWGCDTCQWACPENREVDQAQNREYLPQGELAYPDLLEILTMSNRAFERRFGHTAAAWRGLRTWQRNALIALGNCRNPDAVPQILPFLQHNREELRASAAWALARIGDPSSHSAIRAAMEREMNPVVQDEMSWALGALMNTSDEKRERDRE